MKILIVNTNDIVGGAAKAAYRLHRALLEAGVESLMYVLRKTTFDDTVIGPSSTWKKVTAKVSPTLDSIPLRKYHYKDPLLFSPAWVSSRNIIKEINSIDADVVHLHWTCNGMLRIEDIALIKAPIIWSLHDAWLYTGGCHINWECDKYKQQCGACPRLGSKAQHDLSRRVFSRKDKVFARLDKFYVNGLSKWIQGCAKSSALLSRFNIFNLPNLIDVNVYKPFLKKQARQLLGLEDNKRYILFGAVSATSDINKGFQELNNALQGVTATNVELLVFGSNGSGDHIAPAQHTHYYGYLHDDLSLCVLYNAADVMVVPSRQENLSNAIMESLACGTPVVAFNVGGNEDLIEHKKNGYLATPLDAKDLRRGISWVLDSLDYSLISNAARETVLQKYDSHVVCQDYIKLYKKITLGNVK